MVMFYLKLYPQSVGIMGTKQVCQSGSKEAEGARGRPGNRELGVGKVLLLFQEG